MGHALIPDATDTLVAVLLAATDPTWRSTVGAAAAHAVHARLTWSHVAASLLSRLTRDVAAAAADRGAVLVRQWRVRALTLTPLSLPGAASKRDLCNAEQ